MSQSHVFNFDLGSQTLAGSQKHPVRFGRGLRAQGNMSIIQVNCTNPSTLQLKLRLVGADFKQVESCAAHATTAVADQCALVLLNGNPGTVTSQYVVPLPWTQTSSNNLLIEGCQVVVTDWYDQPVSFDSLIVVCITSTMLRSPQLSVSDPKVANVGSQNAIGSYSMMQ